MATTTVAKTTQQTKVRVTQAEDDELLLQQSVTCHRCYGIGCISLEDSEADLGLGLNDLELDDDVYYDSDFDERPQKNVVGYSSWRSRVPRTCSADLDTASRRDSGIDGSIGHDDCSDDQVYVRFESRGSPYDELVLTTNRVQERLQFRCSTRPRLHAVPRMGTKIIEILSSTTFSSARSSRSSQRSIHHCHLIADSTRLTPTQSYGLNSARQCDNTSSPSSNVTSSSVARQPDTAARWVVRVRLDGSRYVGRSKGAAGDVTHSKHKHRGHRHHRLPGDEDAISQWKRLASNLSSSLTSNCRSAKTELLVLCD